MQPKQQPSTFAGTERALGSVCWDLMHDIDGMFLVWRCAIHEKIALTSTHNSTALLNMVVFIFFFLAQPYLNIK